MWKIQFLIFYYARVWGWSFEVQKCENRTIVKKSIPFIDNPFINLLSATIIIILWAHHQRFNRLKRDRTWLICQRWNKIIPLNYQTQFRCQAIQWTHNFGDTKFFKIFETNFFIPFDYINNAHIKFSKTFFSRTIDYFQKFLKKENFFLKLISKLYLKILLHFQKLHWNRQSSWSIEDKEMSKFLRTCWDIL